MEAMMPMPAEPRPKPAPRPRRLLDRGPDTVFFPNPRRQPVESVPEAEHDDEELDWEEDGSAIPLVQQPPIDDVVGAATVVPADPRRRRGAVAAVAAGVVGLTTIGSATAVLGVMGLGAWFAWSRLDAEPRAVQATAVVEEPQETDTATEIGPEPSEVIGPVVSEVSVPSVPPRRSLPEVDEGWSAEPEPSLEDAALTDAALVRPSLFAPPPLPDPPATVVPPPEPAPPAKTSKRRRGNR